MNNELIIRKKMPGDEAAAARLLVACFDEKYRMICGGNARAAEEIAKAEMKWRGREENFFIAEREGRIVGAMELFLADMQFIPEDVRFEIYMDRLGLVKGLKALYILSLLGRVIELDECCVSHLAVAEDARRCGVARRLLSLCGDFAAKNGKKRLSLWVAENNISAVRLYESEGFVVDRKVESIMGRRVYGINEWLKMKKKI